MDGKSSKINPVVYKGTFQLKRDLSENGTPIPVKPGERNVD